MSQMLRPVRYHSCLNRLHFINTRGQPYHIVHKLTMNFLFSCAHKQRQETVPLLESSPDGPLLPSESEQHGDLSPGESPVTSTHCKQAPSSTRILNLQFGPVPEAPQHMSPQEVEELADLDRKIREALQELSSRDVDFNQAVKVSKKTIRKAKKLDDAYKKEVMKAPVPPPKGTWFQQERRLYHQKMEEHGEKLRSLLRLRGEVIKVDLPQAQRRVQDSRKAVDEAKAKYDKLLSERKEMIVESQVAVRDG